MSNPNAPLVDRVLHERYRVDAHMAEGGMASVYRGHDLRLDRPVALKIMRPDLARDVDFVARFRREARSAAKLSHPHVVSVYDQGEDDGLVYLVMELVPGANLREIIHTDAPLSIRAATGIVDQVLQALSAAHRAGLVHRDIKPENVLTDFDGSVKVADFGLARAVTAGTMSRTNDVMWGTAAYLSPEQVQHGRADVRTDVYAVGLVLYELLTGIKAFGGDTPIHVAFQHVHETVPPVAAQIEDIPGEIDRLIAHATATDPATRPDDAIALRELLVAMTRQLSDQELDAKPSALPRANVTEAIGNPQQGSHSAEPTRPVHQATAVVPLTSAPTEGNYARTTGNRVPKSVHSAQRSGASPATSATPSRAPRRRSLGVILATLLLLIGGGGAVAAWYFTTGPGIQSDMPTVVGLAEQDAVAALENADLAANPTPGFSETVDKGTVMGASEEAGTSLRHGTTVDVEVSAGPERYPVPDLTGQSVQEATDTLEETQLSLGQVSEDFDEDVEAGLILRSAPGSVADPVPPGTAVDVVTSAGPEPIDIPDVTGSPLDEAEERLSEAGFETEEEQDRVNDPDVTEGSVLTQSPASGQGRRGDVITLTISKGPALITMPQVIGTQFNKAKPLLEDLGFQVTREEIAQAFFGTVRFQSIQEGEQVPEGTEVVLSVL